MNLLPFNIHSKINQYTSAWTILEDTSLHEGIRFDDLNGISIDFDKDEPGDVVNLSPPRPAKLTRKADVPIFKGYVMENVPKKKAFAEEVKKWGAIDQDNLKALISHTFPEELKKSNVRVIFTTGSSDPLAVHIAEAIKELYYPNAKTIDIMKKYYGVDVDDIVDWNEYEKADPKTKKMIDSYLNQFKSGRISHLPRNKFEGYIKKSSGLQSGARRLLNPGHSIDDVILDSIADAEAEWTKDYSKNQDISPAARARMLPKFLVVDDTIIEGSTLRGIFKTLLESLEKAKTQKGISDKVFTSIYGYVLFGYKAS